MPPFKLMQLAKKTRARFCVALAIAFFCHSAFSWVWLVEAASPILGGVLWLGRVVGRNALVWRAGEMSLWIQGGLAQFLVWKFSNTPDTSTESLKGRIVLSPNPKAKRQNPDPSKWNDATGRNPVPKSSFTNVPSASTLPPTWPEVVKDMGGVGQKQYISGSGSSLWDVSVTTSPSSASGNSQWNGTPTGMMGTYYVYATSVSITCPAGYQSSGSNCILQDTAKVIKPAGKVVCEVIQNTDGTWDVDTQNQECLNLSSQLKASGKTVTYTRAPGDYDSITQTDTGYVISTRGPGGNKDIKTGPYDSGQDGVIVQSITDLGSSASSSGSGTASSSSGSSGGTSSSSSGTGGGGSCGGPWQPACSIDDNGFNGADTIIGVRADETIAKLDERVKAITDQNGKDTFGITSSWLPSLLPGSPVACQPLNWRPAISHGPASGLAGNVNVDWCSKVDVFREFYGWIVSVSTVVAIAILFFSSNGNASTKQK